MYRTLKLALSVTLMAVVLLLVQGCDTESDDIPTAPAETVTTLIEDGWEQLNNGDYDDALTTFNDAANAEASNLEAYLGLGYAFALSGEPISARRNLGNVLSLGEVMVSSGEMSEAYADTLYAEAYAGRASVALASQDYETAIEEANNAAMIWSEFGNPVHRWLEPDYTLQDVYVMEANAWYGLEEYGEALLLADMLSGGSLITELVNAGDLVEETETVTVTLLPQTSSSGVAELVLSNDNLVLPETVEAGGIEFEVMSYDITGNSLTFKGNPIPQPGDQYTVTYYYAANYGQFLIKLRETLENVQ